MQYLHSITFRLQMLVQVILLLLFLVYPISQNNQAIICGVLLCLIGIPHGANDYLYRKESSVGGLIKFLARYIAIMAAYVLLWYLIPLLALVIFFIISLHHFGQSNFENENFWHLPSILWGIWLLLFPVLIHHQEAMQIFDSMLSLNFSTEHLPFNQGKIEQWHLIVSSFFGLLYFSSIYLYERKNLVAYFLQFVLVTGWFLFTPLLFGFIIVFCIWHSVQSLRHQALYYQRFFSRSALAFFFAMLPFSVLTLFFLFAYIYFFGFQISLSFIMLSVISLPHVLVMHFLYKSPIASSC
jgi:beta-carotene 15,15'-dioxygenase